MHPVLCFRHPGNIVYLISYFLNFSSANLPVAHCIYHEFCNRGPFEKRIRPISSYSNSTLIWNISKKRTSLCSGQVTEILPPKDSILLHIETTSENCVKVSLHYKNYYTVHDIEFEFVHTKACLGKIFYMQLCSKQAPECHKPFRLDEPEFHKVGYHKCHCLDHEVGQSSTQPQLLCPSYQ